MTTLTDLTPRQAHAVVDAALEVAERAGIVVTSVDTYVPGTFVRLSVLDGDGPALAFELELTKHHAHPYSLNPALTVETFEGDWRGVQLTVQHAIPTVTAVTS